MLTESTEKPPPPPLLGEKKSRATGIEELQNRLQSIQSKSGRLTYADKLKKKGLKNRVKRKSKQEERNGREKLLRAQKLNGQPEGETSEVKKPTKPVFNSAGKVVYSKFDFSGIGNEKPKKQENDPKKILQNLQKQKEKLQKLEAEGAADKVAEIKEKTAWKNAIAKAHGEKVKDDPELLKKSVKRREEKQQHSKKKWEKRLENVKRLKDERQKKRTDNIEKRKKDKKNTKLKKAAKKGRIIPGF